MTDKVNMSEDRADHCAAGNPPAGVAPDQSYLSRAVNTISANPARVYLILATISGLIMVFLVPPFQPPDEHPHFFRSYQISRGGLVAERNGEDSGGRLPTSF